jgi:hypothetical protein
LRHPVTNEFLDICKKCLDDIPIIPVAPTDMDDSMLVNDDDDFCVNYLLADDDEQQV